MDTREGNGAPTPDGAEANISHFIPSVELKGSRTEKLQTLDTLIAYLERLRKSLAGDVANGGGGYEGPGRRIQSPTWPWFTAGVFLGALFILLLLAARACSL